MPFSGDERGSAAPVPAVGDEGRWPICTLNTIPSSLSLLPHPDLFCLLCIRI